MLIVAEDTADLEKKKPPKTESAEQLIAHGYGVLKTAKKSPICASSYIGDAGIPLNIPALIVSLFAPFDVRGSNCAGRSRSKVVSVPLAVIGRHWYLRHTHSRSISNARCPHFPLPGRAVRRKYQMVSVAATS